MLNGRRPLPKVLESAGIRYNGDTDYIEVLNPHTNEWTQWEKTGVVFNPCTIIVTSQNLNGKTVTCSVGGESYSTIFVGGAATFTVFTGGTVTVTCEGYSATVEAVEGETLTVDITRPPATLTLNTNSLNGYAVSVQVDGVTYSGTFADNKATFTIYEVGTATITSGGITETQTIASGGSYTVTIDRPSALVKLTTSNLQNQTITFTVNGTTNQAAFGGDGTLDLTVYVFGSYTFSCSKSSKTITVSEGGTYTVDLTDFEKIFYMKNGQVQNGAESSNGTLYLQEGYYVLVGDSDSSGKEFIKIPKNTALIGHTLKVELYAGNTIPYVRYRWGLSSSGYYKDLPNFENGGTYNGVATMRRYMTLTEDLFNTGYTESHYMSVGCDVGEPTWVYNVWVE